MLSLKQVLTNWTDSYNLSHWSRNRGNITVIGRGYHIYYNPSAICVQ